MSWFVKACEHPFSSRKGTVVPTPHPLLRPYARLLIICSASAEWTWTTAGMVPRRPATWSVLDIPRKVAEGSLASRYAYSVLNCLRSRRGVQCCAIPPPAAYLVDQFSLLRDLFTTRRCLSRCEVGHLPPGFRVLKTGPKCSRICSRRSCLVRLVPAPSVCFRVCGFAGETDNKRHVWCLSSPMCARYQMPLRHGLRFPKRYRAS